MYCFFTVGRFQGSFQGRSGDTIEIPSLNTNKGFECGNVEWVEALTRLKNNKREQSVKFWDKQEIACII